MPRTPPLAGDKPQRYISPSTLGCRCSGDGGWCRRPVPEFIPDRSPGHAFAPIAHAGWRRHTKVCKAGVVVWYSELARRILPRPTPTPAGDKPLASRSLRPRYIFSFRHRPFGLQFGTFRRWRAGIEVDWRAHPGSESGTCFRTNRPCRLAPAQQGMTMRPASRKCLGVVGATLPLWIPAFAGMTNGGPD